MIAFQITFALVCLVALTLILRPLQSWRENDVSRVVIWACAVVIILMNMLDMVKHLREQDRIRRTPAPVTGVRIV